MSFQEDDELENVSVFVVLTTCNTLPAGKLVLVPFVNTVPLVVGNVSVVVPATAPDTIVVSPDVEPLNLIPVEPNVGNVAKTKEPEPVSSVTADAKLALVGVARNVATPVPKPLTPVDIGSPVAFVSVAEAGVPNAIALPDASKYKPFSAG
jgi:hypothetical protein